MSKQIMIIGAGLAGLLAAHKFKDAQVIEAMPEHIGKTQQHKALLRFRTEGVSHLTGIPFKKVTVQKAIVCPKDNVTLIDKCNIQLANMYSEKVTGGIGNRSIWNLDSDTRYIAPDDFFARMLANVGDRVQYGVALQGLDPLLTYVNTSPLPVIMNVAGASGLVDCESMKGSPIFVCQYEIESPECDVYQTLYFPSSEHGVYRASITGRTLIIERTYSDDGRPTRHVDLDEILAAFGLGKHQSVKTKFLSDTSQTFGKIVDIPKQQRDAVLYHLTQEYDVFSIGRFATWRNILLDDVVQDLDVVEKLINASGYSRNMQILNK